MMVYTIHLQDQTVDTPHPGPLDGTGEREPIDFYKDSEYIRLYGDKNEDN